MKNLSSNRGALRWLPLACSAIAAPLACAPTVRPATAESEPGVQDGVGEIPWAEGERPEDAEATTRDVGEQPASQGDPLDIEHPDGGILVSDPSRCTGKAPPGLRADVQVRAKEIQSCAEQLPEGWDKMSGELKFSLRVAVSGEVADVEVLADTLNQPMVSGCARDILSKPFEVPPIGGCSLFVVPLTLAAERTTQTQ